jgi:hypothetical protein
VTQPAPTSKHKPHFGRAPTTTRRRDAEKVVGALSKWKNGESR